MLNVKTNSVAAFLNRLTLSESAQEEYGGRLSVWIRWTVLLAYTIDVNYRGDFGTTNHALSVLFAAVAAVVNCYAHYRIRSNRIVTAPWLLALSAMDITLISLSISLFGGIGSDHFVFYYLALAVFAAVFPHPLYGFAGATVVAAVYSAVVLLSAPGLDTQAQDERTLLLRIAVMYAVAAGVILITGYGQVKRITSLERQRDSVVRQQYVEFSQTIHDTTAQSVYMIGLGVETALGLANESDRELVAKLEATHALSKSTIWELRHPIDMGLIFDGRELGQVLKSHAGTFTTITSVPTEVSLEGREPPLSPTNKGLLFSVAHNAMSNAFRHSECSSVTISLDCKTDHIRISISDDGKGLPEDYTERGHGFQNMRRDAKNIGGKLEVSSGIAGTGTTVSCVVPYE